MQITKKTDRWAALFVFIASFIVFYFSAERTGSLWDCGEFILGAYKMQVVHPPGAPLFMLVGRVFALFGDLFSSNPAMIAFAVNLMSSLVTAAGAGLVADMVIKLSRKIFADQDAGMDIAIPIGGIVAGLATAFCTSIWFSAVEGEVYAMSTFFTILTFWAVVRWYVLPNDSKHDRWLVFSAYSAGLSLGVHLLSLLTFPALAILVYYKKAKKPNFMGLAMAAGIGAISIPVIQKLIITGIPSLWQQMDMFVVNSLGLPFNFGLIPTLAIVGGLFYYAFRYAKKKNNHIVELVAMSLLMITIGFSTIGVIVIRANADTPVNMNVPSDASRLLPYINREQYGERSLLHGPHYDATPSGYDREKRYGRVDFPPYHGSTDSEYTVVDEKISAKYAAKDKMLFPRIQDGNQGRPGVYRQWYQYMMGENPKPSFGFNLRFFFKYQLDWMYFRYFAWNFIGRQNGDQGYRPWDKSAGHWESGIKFIDESKLYNMDMEPDTMKNDFGRNNYYFLPLIFGLIGLVFHFMRDQKSFLALFALFFITGIGIIIYTNQPPNEPRERDYVLVGSFFAFCMWMGFAVPSLYAWAKEKFSFGGLPAAGLIGALVLSAPLIMGFQNFDDHSRKDHFASRDYAANFLNSLQPNAILFTYGDNDTYPLWYAQEVEGIRKDVRIVNLSLIAVDWYINKLRSKVNDSPGIKLTIPASSYRGNLRNQIPFYTQPGSTEQNLDVRTVLKFVGEKHELRGSSMSFESFMPTHKMFIPTNYQAVNQLDMFSDGDALDLVPAIPITFPASKSYLTKDDLAILDVVASNIWDRPIYFATTCNNTKLLGLNDYMQYEGLALRVVPIKNKSDKPLGVFGSGRVDTDRAYDAIMNKFAWGNFDKKNLFVDRSYGAAVQSHRFAFVRLAEALLKKGEYEKAVAVADKYFEAFPHMNFAYDAAIMPFINVYLSTKQYDKAKQHLRILANETKQYLDFYQSIDRNTLQSSFQRDNQMRNQALQSILRGMQSIPDEEFKKEMNDMLGGYTTRQVPN